MARLLEYENYKDLNGVKIPDSWELSKVKYLANYLNGFAFKPAHWTDKGTPIIRIQNLTNQNADINKTSFIAPERYHVVEGDILISWSATLDVYMWQGEKAWLNQHIYKVKVNRNKIIEKYFYWTAKWFMGELNESSHGSTMQHLTTDKFGSFNVPLPPISEQHLITNFLDYETAQIDTLIDKQQTLIQLLKEKRQAVISHAVTKGLNSDVPMKDSGVEWLGEVPEHWAVIKLANYAIPLNGDRGSNYPSGNDFVDEGVFFISTSEVVDGYVKTDTASKITLKKYNQLGGLKIKKGDIIYCLRGSVGKSGICTFDEGTISSSLMGIRSMYIDPYYLILLLTSSSELQQRLMLVTGSVSANLSAQNVMGYKFAIPEKAEQLIIIAHVKNSLERIDILLSKATQAIQLMQERRTALISAAVTGKIDVRGWQAPDNKAS